MAREAVMEWEQELKDAQAWIDRFRAETLVAMEQDIEAMSREGERYARSLLRPYSTDPIVKLAMSSGEVKKHTSVWMLPDKAAQVVWSAVQFGWACPAPLVGVIFNHGRFAYHVPGLSEKNDIRHRLR